MNLWKRSPRGSRGVADQSSPPFNLEKLKVFISYSRKDSEFTHRLAKALVEFGYAPNFDQAQYDPDNVDTGISSQDEWWVRLQEMIAESHAMVFIVSPDSAASKICDAEIDYARGLGKRIIPVLCRPIDFTKAPPRLSALNIKIDFTDDRAKAYKLALQQLCAALSMDIAWYRESRRLTTLAARWDSLGRPDALLLAASDVHAISELFERRPGEAPQPAFLLHELRDLSRQRLDDEDVRQRRIIGRAFVKPAEEAIRAGSPEHALRLVAAGALLAKDLQFDRNLDTKLSDLALRAVANGCECAVLRGHKGPVVIACFSPDGRRIVTASRDKTARVWNADTGAEVVCLNGHEDRVVGAMFSPDGRLIVTASADNTARVWDAGSGDQVALLTSHKDTVRTASFSPDGRRIVTASDDATARVWDVDAGAEVVCLNGHEDRVVGAMFSPDGRRIVTASDDATARVWDPERGKETARLIGHEGKLLSAFFNPDGSAILTTSDDETAQLWEVANGKTIEVLFCGEGLLTNASFTSDGHYVFTASRDKSTVTAKLWDARAGSITTKLDGDYTTPYRSAALASNDRWVIFVTGDNAVQVWDVKTKQLLTTLSGHEQSINAVSCSWNGRRIVTGSDDNTARIWGTAAFPRIFYEGEGSFHRVSLSPNAARILAICDTNRAEIWDTKNGSKIASLKGHRRQLNSAAFSLDGGRVVTTSEDRTARIWNSEEGHEIACLRGHEDRVVAAMFSPDGRRIVTASRDKTARVWNADTGAELARLNGHERFVVGASFSPDGRLIVTASGDDTARVWDAGSGSQVTILTFHKGTVNTASFSADGRRIVTASNDDTARVWDVDTGAEVVCLNGHEDDVEGAMFSPDGRRIVSESADKTVRIWDSDNGAMVACLRTWDKPYRPSFTSFSSDGRWLAIGSFGSRETIAVCNAYTGQVVRLLTLHESDIGKVEFARDGSCIVASVDRDRAVVWNMRRLNAISFGPTIALTASLARGIGWLSAAERADVLLQNAASDLYTEALAQLFDPDKYSPIEITERELRLKEAIASLNEPSLQ